jgi:hypothetical protein
MPKLIWRSQHPTHEAALEWCNGVNERRARYGMKPIVLVIKEVGGFHQVYSV